MTIRKVIVSLTLVAIFVLTSVACSGSKKLCPAYSDLETEEVVKTDA